MFLIYGRNQNLQGGVPREEPPSLETLPLEIRCKIMGYLNHLEKQMAAEASRAMDAACNTQYESSSNFRIQQGKEVLVLVVSEVDCKRALM